MTSTPRSSRFTELYDETGSIFVPREFTSLPHSPTSTSTSATSSSPSPKLQNSPLPLTLCSVLTRHVDTLLVWRLGRFYGDFILSNSHKSLLNHTTLQLERIRPLLEAINLGETSRVLNDDDDNAATRKQSSFFSLARNCCLTGLLACVYPSAAKAAQMKRDLQNVADNTGISVAGLRKAIHAYTSHAAGEETRSARDLASHKDWEALAQGILEDTADLDARFGCGGGAEESCPTTPSSSSRASSSSSSSSSSSCTSTSPTCDPPTHSSSSGTANPAPSPSPSPLPSPSPSSPSPPPPSQSSHPSTGPTIHLRHAIHRARHAYFTDISYDQRRRYPAHHHHHHHHHPHHHDQCGWWLNWWRGWWRCAAHEKKKGVKMRLNDLVRGSMGGQVELEVQMRRTARGGGGGIDDGGGRGGIEDALGPVGYW